MKVKVKRILPDAHLPTQSHAGDIGYDLYAAEDSCIYYGNVGKVRTGLQFAGYDSFDDLPTYYAKVEGRSGLAAKGVYPVGGIIDPSYRGELKVMLMNHGIHPKFKIKKGDRIAQLVFYVTLTAPVLGFEEVDEIQDTSRGDRGFGSTGGLSSQEDV